MYGLIYMGDEQNSSNAVLTLDSNSYVIGGVAVDGLGRLIVGQASGPDRRSSSCPTRSTPRDLRHHRPRPEHLARAPAELIINATSTRSTRDASL
jgi:hypothetical protein